MNILKCPVCSCPLHEEGKTWFCEKGHSYDKAKKGYVNLLLANQGDHFVEEGDKKESIAARTRFLNSGKYEPLQKALIETLRSLFGESPFLFCDLACGEGYYTDAIANEFAGQIQAFGVDISKAGILASCTRKNVHGSKNIEYVIGNLDYLPFLDASFDCLLNCFAPINEKEFLRVLKEGGYYLRVLPGTYHLYEFKQALYDEVRLNEKKEELSSFELLEVKQLQYEAVLSREELADLLAMTPYGIKTAEKAKAALRDKEDLKTRIAFDIYLYRKKPSKE